jgi:predicted Zn finger-like uncharacterized protein
MKVTPIRCGECGARLFDTSGKLGPAGEGIEVRVKCWRCGRIVLIWLG